MQIDFKDKRVIAATATAGIVVAVIIVLQIVILMSRPTPVAYVPPQSTAPAMTILPTPKNEEWRDGKELFKQTRTPDGGVINDPAKAAQCQPPRQLYRTDDCVREANGNLTCKLGCR